MKQSTSNATNKFALKEIQINFKQEQKEIQALSPRDKKTKWTTLKRKYSDANDGEQLRNALKDTVKKVGNKKWNER